MKSSTAVYSEEPISSAQSHSPSELSESDMSYRTFSATPDMHARSTTPEEEGGRHLAELEGSVHEKSAPQSPAGSPVEEHQAHSSSAHTLFTESTESRVSEVLTSEPADSVRSQSLPLQVEGEELDHTPREMIDDHTHDHTLREVIDDHTPREVLDDHTHDHSPREVIDDHTPSVEVEEDLYTDDDLDADDTLVATKFPQISDDHILVEEEQLSKHAPIADEASDHTPNEVINDHTPSVDDLHTEDNLDADETKFPGNGVIVEEERFSNYSMSFEAESVAESLSLAINGESAHDVGGDAGVPSERSELLTRSRELLDRLRSSHSDDSGKSNDGHASSPLSNGHASPLGSDFEPPHGGSEKTFPLWSEPASLPEMGHTTALDDEYQPELLKVLSNPERSGSFPPLLSQDVEMSDEDIGGSDSFASAQRPDSKWSDGSATPPSRKLGGRSDSEGSDGSATPPPHQHDNFAAMRSRSDSEKSDSTATPPSYRNDTPHSHQRVSLTDSDSAVTSATPSQGGDYEDQDRFYEGQKVLIADKIQGVVRYVGPTHFAPGVWVGVEIGVPKGRNDGAVKGRRYFTCEKNYGLFVPPWKLTVVMCGSEDTSSVSEDIQEVSESETPDISQHQDMHLPDVDPHGMEGDLETMGSAGDEEHRGLRDGMEGEYVSTPAGSIEQGGVDSNLAEVESTQCVQSDVTSSEFPAPASTGLETRGERSDSFPLAPEVTSQRSQSATPTPAPPPEFAEGASRESSIEPSITNRMTSERLSEEIAQDLTNEAYEAMHKIWKAKQEGVAEEGVAEEEWVADKEPPEELEDQVLQQDQERPLPLTIDEKADQITHQLLMLLLQSESSLACSVRAKRLQTGQDEKEEDPPPSDLGTAHKNEVLPPTKTFLPHLVISTGPPIDMSTPLLSPPSPYRPPPSTGGGPVSSDCFSPPGSPPRHLSHASAARVAAGDRSPFSARSDSATSLDRSTSTDSVVNLLESIKITTAQCMVPSERESIDSIVAHAWAAASELAGFHELHDSTPQCPDDLLISFNVVRAMSPDEERCQMAYVRLVFQLALETIKKLCLPKRALPIWTGNCTVRSLLAPIHSSHSKVSLEELQRRVYAALMRGQLPNRLPTVKFLHKMRRPGGREIDFVDQILIRELRGEEPGWVDYSRDEVIVKKKAADSLLETLVDETAQLLMDIAKRRRVREMQCPARTP